MKTRRMLWGAWAIVLGMSPVFAQPATSQPSPGGTAPSIYEIKVEPMTEAATTTVTGTTLAPYKGQVLLIVNVASRCGYTPQYAGLQSLYEKYRARGFQVIGFPSNDFGGQEPGTEREIVEFCTTNYKVTFPLYAKLHAKGPPEPAPIYKYLTEQVPEDKGPVNWNFEKFLISRDGKVVKRFRSRVTPDDPTLIAAIEAELAKPAPTTATPTADGAR